MKHICINAFDGIPYEALITITDEATFTKAEWPSIVTFPEYQDNSRRGLVDLSFRLSDQTHRFMEFAINTDGSIATTPLCCTTLTNDILTIANAIAAHQQSCVRRKLTLHCTPDM